MVAARGVRGFDRSETPFPIAYPSAARPQAWAAGTPILLLLRLLLGLEPDVDGRRLRTLPGWEPEAGAQIVIDGVHAFGRSWRVASTPDALTVEAA